MCDRNTWQVPRKKSQARFSTGSGGVGGGGGARGTAPSSLHSKITLPTITHFFVSSSGNYDIYKKLQHVVKFSHKKMAA